MYNTQRNPTAQNALRRKWGNTNRLVQNFLQSRPSTDVYLYATFTLKMMVAGSSSTAISAYQNNLVTSQKPQYSLLTYSMEQSPS